ncbi:hypothetical protein JTE90_025555 [Oedothorax gibbosus]|uniref:Uncharacterized protein n=1 Tax=Oedothorax gibbosus TaxID=931172 RepID=A0AAV6TVG7_9ARAC|nr:hypothetical protein JTE90_025555 [Oedothorax gibbosus]
MRTCQIQRLFVEIPAQVHGRVHMVFQASVMQPDGGGVHESPAPFQTFLLCQFRPVPEGILVGIFLYP